MTLKDIATVSGKGGLFKVLAPTKSGVILESMDEAKTKMIATTNHRLSLLNEISIYTTTKEGTVGLDEVLRKIHEDFGDDIGIDSNADPAELKSFLKAILPDYDDARVYVSDIKKLVKWYVVLLKYAPEILTQQPQETKDEEAAAKKEEDKAKVKTPERDQVETKKEKSESKKESKSKAAKEEKKPAAKKAATSKTPAKKKKK